MSPADDYSSYDVVRQVKPSEHHSIKPDMIRMEIDPEFLWPRKPLSVKHSPLQQRRIPGDALRIRRLLFTWIIASVLRSTRVLYAIRSTIIVTMSDLPKMTQIQNRPPLTFTGPPSHVKGATGRTHVYPTLDP